MHEKGLYFIAIVPDGQLKKNLIELKQEVSSKYNTRHALKSPPHITLHMPFQWRNDREGALLNAMDTIGFLPFQVEVKDFGAFFPRALYVDVLLNSELSSLHKEVRQVMRNVLKIDNADYKNLGFKPHITLAHRDLKKPVFEIAWKEFKNRKFEGSMRVDNFCLLKHNGKTWDILERISAEF